MYVLYVCLTSITAIGAGAAAWLNLTRHPIPVAAAEQVQVPQSWIPVLGTLLGAAALGLLAGFAVPALGISASAGLVLYFIGAIVTHLRIGDLHLGRAATCLVLAVATLVVTVAYWTS